MLSLALGIGVAMEPNLFEGGGVASFYGKNLRHNTGFWPRYKTCKTFPVDSETGALVRTCTNNNGACCSSTTRARIPAGFPRVRLKPVLHRLISTQVLLRVRQGRGTRRHRDDGDHPLEDALRHRLVVALFLHLLLPEDKEEEEEEESGKEMKVDPVEA